MTPGVIELLQQLIRNACVNDGTPQSGQEVRSVETLRDFFGVGGDVFEPVPGRQSLIYRIEGTDSAAPSLALVPHLDVVPVQEDGWSQDPFGADIVDGLIYGRGAVDMLNVTSAMAVAARPYIRGELEPRGDLIFIGAADEEAGGVHGAHALVDQRWELVAADYLLTEVAYPAPSHVDEPTVPVAVGEKGAFWSILKSSGTPGHGSAPYRSDNALEKMVEDDRIEAVFCATDAPGHARHAICALEHGKHVASAVPAVFENLEEADRLFDAVKRSGLNYMLFETSCYHPDLHATTRGAVGLSCVPAGGARLAVAHGLYEITATHGLLGGRDGFRLSSSLRYLVKIPKRPPNGCPNG